MANQTVTLTFTGDASQLEAATKQAQRALNDVADSAENSSAKVDKGLKKMGDSAGKAGSSAMKLAGSIGNISPAAGKALGGLGDLADVAEVAAEGAAALGVSSVALGAALVVVAQVMAAAYVAYKVYNEEGDRAAAISADAAAAEQARIPIVDALKASVTALAVATGEMSEEQAKLADVSEKAFDRLQKATEASRKKLGELRTEQSSVWTQMVDGAESIVPAWTPLGMVIDGLTTNSSEYEEQIVSLDKEVMKSIALTKEQTTNDKEAIKITEKKRRGKEAAKDAEKEASDAAREALALEKAKQEEAKKAADALLAEIDASVKLVDQVKRLDETQQDRIARDFRDLDAELQKQIQTNKGMGLSTEALEESRVELKEKTAAAYKELAQEEVDAQKDADAEKKQSAKDSAEAIVSAYSDIAGQLGDVAAEIGSRFEDALSETQSKIEEIDSQLSDLSENSVNASELSGEALVQAYKDGEVAAEDLSAAQKKTIKDRLNAEKKALKEKEAAEKKAALAAFRIAQAVAIVQTIIATAQGVMSAFQLGPIAGAIAAVAIGALGAVQVGLIASEQPSFAAGGFLNGAATTGTPVTMHPNEAVLNQQGRAMMGDDAIRDANAGRGGGGRSTGQIVYKNRAFNYFMSDHLNTNGALARTIRKGDRVGLVGRGRRV